MQVSHQPQESREEAESGRSEDDSALLSSICYRAHTRSCLPTPSALSRPACTDTEDKTTNQQPDTSRLHPQDTPKPQINRGESLVFMYPSSLPYVFLCELFSFIFFFFLRERMYNLLVRGNLCWSILCWSEHKHGIFNSDITLIYRCIIGFPWLI